MSILVSTVEQYMLATKKVVPVDITLQADLTFTFGDIPVPNGVTVDLGGHTVTLVDMLANPTIRRGFALGDGSTLRNGTIVNCGWPVYRNAGAKNQITVRYLNFRNVQGMCKFGASGNSGGITESVVIENCRAELTGVPGTIIDLGPGSMRDVTIRNVRTHYVLDPTLTNTGSDGIGIETALGDVLIEDCVIDGCLGDAYDIKGNATIRRCWAINSSRQAFKVWGRKDKPTIFEDCVALNCGYGSMANAGQVTVKGCYLEGGWRDNYAIMFGAQKPYDPNAKDQWGNPNDYGCGGVDATVTYSQFIARVGMSRLIEAEKENAAAGVRAANVTFDKCTFLNVRHPHIFVGSWYQSTENAKKGIWDPHITNSTYGDVPAPVLEGYTPPVVPPIVEPPVVPPVEPPTDPDALTALALAVAELQAWRENQDSKTLAVLYRLDKIESMLGRMRNALMPEPVE